MFNGPTTKNTKHFSKPVSLQYWMPRRIVTYYT